MCILQDSGLYDVIPADSQSVFNTTIPQNVVFSFYVLSFFTDIHIQISVYYST